MLTSDTTILATLEPGNPIAGAADMGYNGVQGTGKAQLSDLAWVIGLIVVVIVSLLFAGWSIMRLSKWRRELGVISNEKDSSFSLTELQEMQKKGLISQQEYQQLRQAYIKESGK